jgi:hypothetical protein
MSDYQVISEVSKAFKHILETKMTTSPLTVTISAPDEEISNNTNRINLFLYQVLENIHLKNQDWQMSSPNKMKPPPLALNLFYLLTPYPQNPNDYTNAHLIMGEAMQIIFNNPILTSEYLNNAAEKAKLILNPVTLDDLTKLWSAINKPYRLSASYEVSLIQIDPSAPEKVTKIVKERKVKVEPYSGPPVIDKLDPESGKSGNAIRIIGSNLKGKNIEVRIGGRAAEEVTVINNSEISFVVPAGLPPYIYEVVVNVNEQSSNPAGFEVIGE